MRYDWIEKCPEPAQDDINYKYDGFRVSTNPPVCGARRGYDCPHSRFAFESLMTRMAVELGLDPMDVRLKNAMEPGTRTVNGLDIGSCELKACLRHVRKASGWDDKWGKLPFGKGIGVGCGGFVSGAAYPIYRSKFPHSTVGTSPAYSFVACVCEVEVDTETGQDAIAS